MTKFSDLQPIARIYVAAVVAAGGAALAHSLYSLWVEPIGSQWLVIAALTLLTGSFTIKVPSINASLSVSETFVFAAVLLFGAPAGAATVLLECLIILLWMKPKSRPGHLILFNTAAPAISIWISGSLFFLLSGIPPYSHHTTPLSGLFVPLLVFTSLYFILNSWLVAIALGFETQQSAVQIWWKNFTWLSVNYFSGASVAALLVTYTPSHALDFSTLAIIVPLLVVSYLTFRTAMGRVEDSNNHLSELNRLYLSTIETLAMAIDAKDQITHGHIRRVQTFAVGLAKQLGVFDATLLKAIEAAALLHDMGKLAVPEYILNKPGRLTDAEFAKMKLHASVGADILSAIDFPYPVVPIVRHHHENWDGTGYPGGLKGTDIPIGARILSVVDCFDALTSDRPYRPRLSDAEALTILLQRKGSMYDPLVVDTFIRVYSQLSSGETNSRIPRHVLNEIAGSIQPAAGKDYAHLEKIASSSDEMITLYELANALKNHGSIIDTGRILASHLRRLVPFSHAVLFLYDAASDELHAKHVTGHSPSLLDGLKIPRGQRLSGWVAANKRTIVNSDPVLDLGDVARTSHQRLRSCLSTHISHAGQLIGVLTLYSDAVDAFDDSHRHIIEVVAAQVAPVIRSSIENETRDPQERVSGLPGFRNIEQIPESTHVAHVGNELSLIFIKVVGPINTSDHIALDSSEALRQAASLVKQNLRVGDLLFRFSTDELVALLNNAEVLEGEAITERIRASLKQRTLSQADDRRLNIRCEINCVSIPADGRPVADLVASAHASIARRRQPVQQVH